MDGAAYATCSGLGSHTVVGLSEGAHSFAVRATDVLGNTEVVPPTRSFTVDTAAPETTIVTSPAGSTPRAPGSFTFAPS